MLLSYIVFLAASVERWTAPPPAWKPTDQFDLRTVNMTVRIGSTQVPLRWNYTLSPGSTVTLTTFSIVDGNTVDNIGVRVTGGAPTILDTNDYLTRFAISSSEVATLIIIRVTEREDAVYQCQVLTTTEWNYRIRVIVTGELYSKTDT